MPTAFGEKVLSQTVEPWATAGDAILSNAWRTALEPAPIMSTDEQAAPFRLLSGTILAVEKASGRGLERPGRCLWRLPERQVGFQAFFWIGGVN
jgi:hypothetical protein